MAVGGGAFDSGTSALGAGAGAAYLFGGPVGWAVGLATLAGGIFGGASARRAQERLKREIERRRVGLIESKNIAVGRVEAATAAARTPLEAIADRVRRESDFRDPVLEQSLVAGTRAQIGGELRRTEATQSSASLALPQQNLLMAAVMSQSLLSGESRRLARRAQSTQELTRLYSQMGEITQAGASTAAGIEGQYASALNSLPYQDQTSVGAAQIGGFLAFLNTDSGKEGLGALFKKFGGGGGGGNWFDAPPGGGSWANG